MEKVALEKLTKRQREVRANELRAKALFALPQEDREELENLYSIDREESLAAGRAEAEAEHQKMKTIAELSKSAELLVDDLYCSVNAGPREPLPFASEEGAALCRVLGELAREVGGAIVHIQDSRD